MRRTNRQHDGGGYRRIANSAMLGLSTLMALAWLLAGEVRPAAAAHFVQEGFTCYSCHTLDDDYGDLSTSFINRTSRTMIEMKSANLNVTPAQFGCTYCHNIGFRTQMKAVLNHFSGSGSRHPVGKNFVTGNDSNREYLSSWDTAFANELDCVDCHDVETYGDGRDDPQTAPDEGADGDPGTSLLSTEFGNKYPEHGPSAFASNPYMLRNVTALNEYDPLCRACHGNTAPLVKGLSPTDNNMRLNPATAHADGVPVGSGGSGPIVEDDGTDLKTTAAGGNDQCRKCHDTHYSSKQKLFNDGHENVSGTATPETAIDIGTECTACHFPGDAAGFVGDGPGENTFTRHGHGMAQSTYKYKNGIPDVTGNYVTLGYGCGNCHTVNSSHDSPFSDTRAPRMLAATPDPTLSSYGKSQLSICSSCHGDKIAHQPGGASVGCIDCHDEHAEGVGATSNIFMIPQQLPNRSAGATELSVFEHNSGTDFDYYINDGTAPHVPDAGLCDNSICHAGLTAIDLTPITPLSGLMTGGHHFGDDQNPLSDCQGCHQHVDTSSGGSFSGAENACNSCHGYPPVSLATSVPAYADQPLFYNETRTPHNRHAGATPAGYGIDCRMCHSEGANSISHRTPTPSFRSIWFDGTWNPSATPINTSDPVPQNTPNYTWDGGAGGYRCSQIYCHSDGSSTAAVGSAIWMTGFNTPDYAAINLECDACHGDGDGDGLGRSYPNDAAGNHARHVGKNAGCENCHFATTTTGVTIDVGGGQHVDREKDVGGGGIFATYAVSFGWDGGTKTCSAVSCHSGERFQAAPITWASVPGPSSCTHCHNNGVNDGNLANSWPLTTPTADAHQLHAGVQPADYGYACTQCHPANRWDVPTTAFIHEALDKSTSVIFTGNFVVGGVWDNNGPNNIPGDGDDNTCAATYCHGDGPVWMADWDDRLYRDTLGATQPASCDACHGTAGQGTGRPNSPTTGGRHTGTTHATLGCTTCHTNTNTDKTTHAQGPAQPVPPASVRSDAGMVAAIDTAPYWRAGSAALDQGFSWTGGTCGDMTTGCHPAATWGQTTAGGQPLGCALCHGDRVIGSAWPDGAVPPWPDANPAPPPRGSYYFDNEAGSHPAHIAALQAREGFLLTQANQTAMCAYCHMSPGSAAHRTDTGGSLLDRVDVINDGRPPNVGTFSRIDSVSDFTATADGNIVATYNNATRTCSASDCHYEKPTPSATSLPVYANGWDDGDTVAPTCETCHFTRGLVNAVTYPTRAYVPGATAPAFPDGDLPDAHSVHVSGIASGVAAFSTRAGKAYPCSTCHDLAGYTTAHVDGSIGVSPLGAPRFNGDDTITPVSTAVKYGVATANTTCANLYCHGADFSGDAAGVGGTRGTDITPVWNDHTTGTCGKCHDVDTEAGNVFEQQLTQGAHGTHLAGKSLIAWGPGLNSHSARCQVCHGWKPDGSSGTPVGCATSCHGGTGTGLTPMPGGAFDAGYAWEPSLSHVEGNFEVDFENFNRGWSDAIADPYNGSGTLANRTNTDICNRCHGTALVGGEVGATVAKANWPTAARITNCLLCHNQALPGRAYSRAVIGGVDAPGKETYYELNGHGNAGAFNATLHGQTGPGYACQICHTENAAHISGALGQDRLESVPIETPALPYTNTPSEFCLACHKVGGAGVTLPNLLGVPTPYDSVAEATVHSGGVNNRYNSFGSAPGAHPAYGDSASLYATDKGYQCNACHDPHGTGKLAMVLDSIDGNFGGIPNPLPVNGFQSTDLNLLDLDPSTNASDGVCDLCHRAAGDTMAHPDTTPPFEAVNGNHYQGGAGASCVGCHSHAESFRGSCARCHGNETTGQIWPDEIPGNNSAQTPGNAYADNEAGSHAEHIAALVAKEGFGTSVDDQIAMCAYCHPNPGGIGHENDTPTSPANQVDLINDTIVANNGVYKRVDGVSNLAGANDVHNAGAYVWATKSCSGIDCHYEKPTPTAPAQPAYPGGWDSGNENTPGCATCHADDTAYPAGNLPNAHTVHVDETLDGGYDFACTQCHPSWVSTQHLNGAVDLTFGAATGEPGGIAAFQTGSDFAVKYDQTGGGFLYATCNALYCHGDDAPFPTVAMSGTVTRPKWDVAANGDCGTCHLDTTASWNGRGSNWHSTHVGTLSYDMGCDICHASVSSDGTTITTRANHVNFEANVAFSATDPRVNANPLLPPMSSYGGDTIVGSGYGICANTFCHSPGTDLVPPFEQAPNSPTMTWDTASTSCSNCHDGPLGGGPTYANGTDIDGTLKANRHQAHRLIFSTSLICTTCHGSVYAAFTTLHANGSYDPSAGTNNALDDFNFTRGAAAGGVNGRCDTVVCHGGNTVDWGEDMTVVPWSTNNNHFTCDICHGESGGIPTSTDFNDFSIDITAAGAVMSKVSATEYNATNTGGHGSTIPKVIGKDCNACHSSTVNHETTAANLSGLNPFRLRDNGGTGPGNFTCSDITAGCHFTSPSRDVVDHTALNMQAAGHNPQVVPWSFTPKCVDCHDPHGDGANLKMITGDLIEGSAANWVPSVYPPENQALVFTDLATGIDMAVPYTSYADNGTMSSLCQECHETPDLAMTAFKDGVAANVFPHPSNPGQTGPCSVCHTHDTAFKPSGCYGCHGGGTTVGLNKNYWPDGPGAWNNSAENDIGRHPIHMQRLALARYNENITNLLTDNTPGYPLLTSDDKQKELCSYCHTTPGSDGDHAQTFPADVNTLFTLWAKTADNGLWNVANGGTCATTDCHNNKLTTNTAPNDFSWYGNPSPGNASLCVMCHLDVTADTTHLAHTNGSATFGRVIVCADCHEAATNWSTNTPPAGTAHINGTFAVAGNVVPMTYSGFVYPGTKGSCTTNFCHNDGAGGTPINNTYLWNNTPLANCTICHLDAPATGNHTDHFSATYGPGFGTDCGACHAANANNTTMAGKPLHINGTVEFQNNVTTTVAASALGLTAPVGGGLPNATSTDRCNNCHSTASVDLNTVGVVVGTVLAKQNWSDGGYTLPCLSCHNGTPATDNPAGNVGPGDPAAPNMLGNDSASLTIGYGAEVRGHNRTTEFRDAANTITNPAPNRLCDSCHDIAAGHFNNTDDTAYAQMRLLGTINSQATGSVTGICNACHTSGIGTRATSFVSTHGNSAYLLNVQHDPSVAEFAYRCEACHEPHGLTNDAPAPTYANIYMVRPLVGVGSAFTSVPVGADATTIPIRFQRITGVDSYDDNLTQADNICVGCHINAARPDPDVMLNSDGNHSEVVGGFTGNEQGKNCVSCHTHDIDSVQATVDGFMPLRCDECHSYPGLTGGTPDKTLSPIHNIHVDDQASGGYGFACETCHYNYDHNGSNFISGTTWDNTSVLPANINIRFNPAWNPDLNLTYGGAGRDADVGTTGIATHDGVCAGLYCHGNSTSRQADWAGTTEQPAWNPTSNPVRFFCRSCHADPPASGAHTLHSDTNDEVDRTDCELCHIDVAGYGAAANATTDPANHVNGTTTVAFAYGNGTLLNGYCTGACHNSTPFAELWNEPSLACSACHYYNTAGNPSAVTNTAGSTFRPISELSHDGHFASTGRVWACNDCHPNNALDTSPLAHVTSGSGTDAQYYQGRAIPVQSNAAISTTQVPQWWDAPGDWTGNVTKTCSNRCHDPSAGVKVSTAWGTTNTGCEFCHNAATAPATGSHVAHIGAAATYGVTIVCTDCHNDNSILGGDGHMTGLAEVARIQGVTPYSGALTPPWNATFGLCTTATCHNNGDGVTPVPTAQWGSTIADPNCGICHAQTPTTGSHNTHLAATAYGPHPAGSIVCNECHQSAATNTSMAGYPTHNNGSVTFLNRAVPASPFQVASGQIGQAVNDPVDSCNNCHGGLAGANAAAGAKDSWAGATRLACETCHGTYALARQNANGTGTTAPDKALYYATANGGHGSVAPAQSCGNCHNENGAHIDATGGNEDRIVQANLTTFCQYCHDNAVDDLVAGQSVVEVAATKASVHGNTSASYAPTQWPKEANFALDCADCHDAHGTANISMVNTTINATAVTYTSDTQWDTVAGSNDICEVCHTQTEHNGNGPVGQHQADYRDMSPNPCRGCHAHEFDNNEATADAFMPAACNACHTFPGLPTAGAEHTLSPIHNIHVDPQASGGYNFACTACHFGYGPTHNQSLFADGGSWTDVTVPPATIHIRFDTALNPTNQTDYPRYNSINATTQATTGIATHAGTCAGLSCHGNNQATQLDWAGSAEQPAWNPTINPARYSCGSCHADPPASGAHALHADAADEADRTDCVLCHSAAGGYGAAANTTTDPANHVNGTTQVGFAYGDGTLLNGFCTGACHASTVTAGRWNDSALACDACHYYNTAGNPSAVTNTAGSTFRPISEASHDAHFTAPGRTWACNDCHTNNVADAGPLTHVTSGSGTDALFYQGRAIPTQSEATISTTVVPLWWDAPGDWTGNVTKTCSNRCHDPSSGVKVSNAWGTANAVGCEFCHNSATAPATGSHVAHIGAQGTYGLTIQCVSCHPNNAGTDGHMTGSVEIANLAGATPYAGALTPPWNATFGACTTATCHNNGDGATAVLTSQWGTSILDPNCAICHLNPPTNGRHVAHIANTNYVSGCASCHGAAAQSSHIDGSVTWGGTVSSYTAPTCANLCHLVNAANGDWLDANPLACTDCHHGLYLYPDPSSGLHKATTALAHDDDFNAAPVYTCTNCHDAAAPSAAHLAGGFGAQNSTQTVYSFNASYIPAGGYDNTGYPADTSCRATCHSDYKLTDTGGLWQRRWVGVTDAVPLATDNPGDPVCANCHGDFTNGWNWNELNASTTDHTDPYSDAGQTTDAMGTVGEHPDCQICHGWGYAGYDRGWNGTPPAHGDGSITMNGPDATHGTATGAQYNDTTGGCAAACHIPGYVLKTNSGWTANYGDFGAGNCEDCHDSTGPGPNVMGDGTNAAGVGVEWTAGVGGPKPYDDGTWGYNVNGHGANGGAPNTPWSGGFPAITGDAACTDCHTIISAQHRNGAFEARVLTDPSNMTLRPGAATVANPAHLDPLYIGTSSPEYDVQLIFDNRCSLQCHPSAIRHRHTTNAVPAAGVVRFGDLGVRLNGQDIVGIPIDIHISSNAPSAAAAAPPYDYAPCFSCHNPHGTPVVEPAKSTNKMIRFEFDVTDTLCRKCH